MSNEADSFETLPAYRWAETNAEVPVAGPTDLAEPSSGQKDVGFVVDTQPNRGWINWLFWSVGVAFRYLRNWFALWWVTDCVMPGCDAAEGVVTAGAGLSVNVTSVRVMLSAQFYEVPAWTNHALSAADPTDDRYDLVYARLSGGVPTYAVVTGTPAGSPTVPATPAGGVAIASVLVPAAAAAPSTIADLRVFGELVLDRLEAASRLRAWLDTGVYNLRVDGAAGVFQINRAATTLLQTVAGPWLEVKAANFRLMTAIDRRFDLHAWDFQVQTGSATFGAGTGWQCETTTLIATVRLHKGLTITAIRLYGERLVDTAAEATIIFTAIERTTFASVPWFETNGTGTPGPLGTWMVEITGLSHVVDQDDVYTFQVSCSSGGSGGLNNIYSGEVVCSEQVPFLTV